MNQKTFPKDKASLKKYEKRVQNFTLGRLEKEWEAVNKTIQANLESLGEDNG